MKALFYFLIFLVSTSQVVAQSTVFVSSAEAEVEVERIAVCPIADNVSGIYANPLTNKLKEWVQGQERWTLMDCKMVDPASPEQLSDNPERSKKIMKDSNVAGFMTGRVSKGPGGMTLSLVLIAGSTGRPLAIEQIKNYSGFDIADVTNQMQGLFQRVLQKIPYDGKVLSRKGQLVTINLGERSGVRAGDELLVVQITKLNRHPKFHFVVTAEKEIMGRLRVEKSEDHLSFAAIESERSNGVLGVGSKIIKSKFVKYPNAGLSQPEQPMAPIMEKAGSGFSFGDNAKAWRSRAPAFGKLSLQLGMGTYGISNNLSIGAVSSSANLVPSIHLGGELWFNPQWYTGMELHQFIARVANGYPNPGSSPDRLSISTNQMSLVMGYNFLIEDEFWGPKIQLYGGYGKMDSFVDQSTPTAFTSQQYSGLMIGIGGSFPVQYAESSEFTLGAKYNYYLSSSMSESPVESGSSSGVRIANFSLFASVPYKENINLKTDLNFDIYGTSFSGSGTRADSASSASHSMTTLAFGAEYLF